MKVTILPGVGGALSLPIPEQIVDYLKLRGGDELVIDVSNGGHELIVYPVKGTTSPTMRGVKEVTKWPRV